MSFSFAPRGRFRKLRYAILISNLYGSGLSPLEDAGRGMPRWLQRVSGEGHSAFSR
jgi:hypothetical protein